MANTKNIVARANKVYLDKFIKGDHVNSAKLEISQRNSRRKYSKVNVVAGAGGYVLHTPVFLFSSYAL